MSQLFKQVKVYSSEVAFLLGSLKNISRAASKTVANGKKL